MGFQKSYTSKNIIVDIEFIDDGDVNVKEFNIREQIYYEDNNYRNIKDNCWDDWD